MSSGGTAANGGQQRRAARSRPAAAAADAPSLSPSKSEMAQVRASISRLAREVDDLKRHHHQHRLVAGGSHSHSHSHSPSHRRSPCSSRSNWIYCVQLAVLFAMALHYWTSFRSIQQQLNKAAEKPTAANARFGERQRLPPTLQQRSYNSKDLNPFDNVAPASTALLVAAGEGGTEGDEALRQEKITTQFAERTNGNGNGSNEAVTSAIQTRHECIAAIRKRQSAALEPYLLDEGGGNNNSSSSQLFRHVLLVDPAYHRNVGDHMLSLGELEFLRRRGYGSGLDKSGSLEGKAGKVLQCNYCQAGTYVTSCPEVLSKLDPSQVAGQPAMWHAGGNWGDLWRDAQWPRLDSFSTLLKKNYTVIGMPQSFHYVDTGLERKDADKLKEKVTEGLGGNGNDLSFLDTGDGRAKALSRVVLTWREVESHAKAKQWYPFVTNIIMPDIAFQLGPYERPTAEETKKNPMHADILLFMRDDKESVLAKQRNKGAIRDLLSTIKGGEALQISIVDWKDTLQIFETNNYFFSENSIKLMSLGRVVICDRLHASILCYLAGIPFVYIDQVSGKISKTLGVAFDSWDGCKDGNAGMWARATDMKMALELAVSFLDKYKL